MQRTVLVCLLGIACLAGVLPSFAQQMERYEGRMVRPGELMVKIKPGITDEKNLSKIGGRLLRRYTHIGWQHIALPAGMNIAEGVGRFRKLADVADVEPDYLYKVSAVSNDPRMSSLWGLTKIGAPAAWDSTTGTGNVVVAVLDTGINYQHEDLQANMWHNPGEIPGNNVDDDRNGYVDDVYGIDTGNGDADPMDDAGHGTHVAGTIGAVGNNGVGVAGVNWSVKLMAVKFIRADGYGSVSDAVAGYDYILAMKQRGVNVRAINDSWGGPGSSQALKDAIDSAGNAGIASICSAGNDDKDIDSTPDYPSSYTSQSIISVAASDVTDDRGSFSNYGVNSVDLAAPGVSILSTYYTAPTAYGYMNGTSMATPHVTGAVALLAAKNPSLTVAQIKSILLDTVDKLPQWSGVVASGGRLNLARAMENVTNPIVTAQDYQPDLAIRNNSSSIFIGGSLYGSEQAATQQVATGTTAIYQLRAQNAGNSTDSFAITGPGSGSGWTVRYYNAASGGTDITSQVTGTGWHTPTISVGGTVSFRVEVIPGSTVPAGSVKSVNVSASSVGNTTKIDTVQAMSISSVQAGVVTSVSLTANPTSPQMVNTNITLTAAASGAKAEYQFQVIRQTSLSSYRVVTIRGYNTNPTVIWRPSEAGTYTIRLNARAVGSIQSYQKYVTLPFSVNALTTALSTSAMLGE